MIVLDTNVVSELMKTTPEPRVFEWVRTVSPLSVFTTSVTEAEILTGVRLLPSGRRRDELMQAALRVFTLVLAGRVLSFGREAAARYAVITSERQKMGRPIPNLDAQIVSIAGASGARLATRNIADFDACGVEVINPWNYTK